MSLDDNFPKLRWAGYLQTSPPTARYNCIAWAAQSQDAWWWPDSNNLYYWPPGVPREETLGAFILAYSGIGYVPCGSAELEVGFEKIAIYALHGQITHASRQLPDGRWTSKLGVHFDIAHTFDGLDGPAYGTVVQVMKRNL